MHYLLITMLALFTVSPPSSQGSPKPMEMKAADELPLIPVPTKDARFNLYRCGEYFLTSVDSHSPGVVSISYLTKVWKDSGVPWRLPLKVVDVVRDESKRAPTAEAFTLFGPLAIVVQITPPGNKARVTFNPRLVKSVTIRINSADLAKSPCLTKIKV